MDVTIKFYLGEYGGPAKANYATEAIAIAQGLVELGVKFYANIDYWKQPETGTYLFQKAPADFQADVNVFVGNTFFFRQPENLAVISKAEKNILLERNDELVPYWQHEEFKALWDFDHILIVHYNHDQAYPTDKVIPWQIGFTNRMQQYIERNKSVDVKKGILDTFRLHHNIRNVAIASLQNSLGDVYPTYRQITDGLKDNTVALSGDDLEYWNATGKRHNPEYYDLINKYLLNYCFGGFYHPKPSSQRPIDRYIRQWYKLRIKLRGDNDPKAADLSYIYQWDSFRFWETLLSNGCPLTLDMESWRFQLPVNPVNWEHYIGVEGFDFDSTARKVRQLSDKEIKRIADQGRDWALEYYRPEAVAKRLLDIIEGSVS